MWYRCHEGRKRFHPTVVEGFATKGRKREVGKGTAAVDVKREVEKAGALVTEAAVEGDGCLKCVT